MNSFDEPVEPTPPDELPKQEWVTPPAGDQAQHPAVEPGSVLRSHSFERVAAIVLGVIVLAGIGAYALAHHSSKPAAVSQVGAQPQGRFGGRFGGRGFGLRRMLDPRAELGTVAQTIGISQDDLISGLQSGQSIADIAKAHHVDPNKVIDAIYNDEKQQVQQAVSSGQISQSQADQLESALKQRIAARVNGTGSGPAGGRFPGGPPAQQQAPRSTLRPVDSG